MCYFKEFLFILISESNEIHILKSKLEFSTQSNSDYYDNNNNYYDYYDNNNNTLMI